MAERVAAAPQLQASKPSPSPRISFPTFPGSLSDPLPSAFFPASLGYAMTSPSSLSPALREFVEHPGPASLMLRSAPGTARDRVVEKLFAAFRGTCFFLSPPSPRGLSAPPGGARVLVVDQSLPPTTLDQAARTRAAWARLVRGGLPEYAESDFLWLPGALQEVWSRLDGSGPPALVVLDGWDRWVEAYLGLPSPPTPGFPDRASLERDLVRRMAQLPVHLVFLVEPSGSEALEFLVNTVVALGATPQEDRLLRLRSASSHRPRTPPSSGPGRAPRGPELTHPGSGPGQVFGASH